MKAAITIFTLSVSLRSKSFQVPVETGDARIACVVAIV